ncbi:MAG TPA: questin oxidase family protein [Stellaceae bacterium]|nr:questin oxidase family protein [Stellaceae bacterium]
MPIVSYETLDAALDRLAGCGPALANGNFNHAPMVAEALCALGRPEAVLPWIERYRPRIAPRQAFGEAIDAARWRHELGRRERFAAWGRFFAGALDTDEWRSVLDLWAARLAPGVSAAATHGAIRVGHAARGLAERETSPRRRELADALASWAASYAELPSGEFPGAAGLSPREALARVPVVPPNRRRPGNIVAALARLAEFPDFAPAIGLAALDGDIAARLAELTELFARVYLANARSIATVIAFIHGVTSLAAIGNIAAHVAEATAGALLRYGWQAGCGLYACFAGDTPFATDVAEIGDAESLVERAVANGDEHVIKFAEACLQRHRVSPSPAYPACVAHALGSVAR